MQKILMEIGKRSFMDRLYEEHITKSTARILGSAGKV
jgi:hypothetical protein